LNTNGISQSVALVHSIYRRYLHP